MIPTTSFVTITDDSLFLARTHPATRIAGLLLALWSFFVVPAVLLPVFLALIGIALYRTGLTPAALTTTARPWLLIAVLVLVIHTLTTIEAAPLGHPSWQGFLRGVTILARIIGAAGSLVLFLRITPLRALTAGIGWWCKPWRRFGLDSTRLSLVLAVALGSVPNVLTESRRMEAAVRLRRGGVGRKGRGLGQWWNRILDKGHLVLPLLESLFRRAEGVTLTLQNRSPDPTDGMQRPPTKEIGILVLCLVLLVLMTL